MILIHMKEKLCIYVTILTHWFFLRKKLNHFLRKKLYSEHSNVTAVVLYRLDLMIQTLMNENYVLTLQYLSAVFFLEKTKPYSGHCNFQVAVLNRQALMIKNHMKEKLCTYLTILTCCFFPQKNYLPVGFFLRKKTKLYSVHCNFPVAVLNRQDIMILIHMKEKLCTYHTILTCCFFLRVNHIQCTAIFQLQFYTNRTL